MQSNKTRHNVLSLATAEVLFWSILVLLALTVAGPVTYFPEPGKGAWQSHLLIFLLFVTYRALVQHIKIHELFGF
jgi:hypothetical protein